MEQMKGQSVDLIYLDPPFNSSQTYNLMYRTLTGRPVPEQAEAFFDTWQMTQDQWAMLDEMPILVNKYDISTECGELWKTWLYALRDTQPKLLSYLLYMLRRLMQMKSILKTNGSIYLHCDPTASHYLKVLMDGIFGHQNFRSEIIWKRTSAHNSAKRYGPVHDTILFYTKSDDYTWNPAYQPLPQETIDAWYNNVEANTGRRFNRADMTAAGKRTGSSGRAWRGIDVTAKGRHWAIPGFVGDVVKGLETTDALDALDKAGRLFWPKREGGMPMLKRYLDESKGIPALDVITDIDKLNNVSAERLGYQTQKPVELLDRIIRASSHEGDIVFDPFCGCGTTVYAAHEAHRRWLGCDIAVLAVDLVAQTIYKRYGLKEGEDFHVTGIPTSVDGAELLFNEDPQEFQAWAVQRVGGLPMKSKSNDRGIDGRLYYEAKPSMRSMVLQVKGGKNIGPTDIRDLRGVLEREKTVDLAGFISLAEPSKAMRREAIEAGVFVHNDVPYPRIQMLTIKQILEDKAEFKSPSKIKARVSTGQAGLPI